MKEYYARQAAGERRTTRFWIGAWIAEMAWVSFFGMKSVARPNECSLGGFAQMTILCSLNYIVPFWFLLQAFGLLIIGKADDARASLIQRIEKIVRWYRAAPTLTFIAFGLLLWTAYNVSFRYHVTLDYRDSYPDDLAKVATTIDSLTGEVTRRVFSEQECAAAEEYYNRPQ
jgi:hypothetical protein